jgi:hypothetical protein
MVALHSQAAERKAYVRYCNIRIHIRPLKKYRWRGMAKMTHPEAEFFKVQDLTSAMYFDEKRVQFV